MTTRNRLAVAFAAALAGSTALVAQQLQYPATRKVDHVDTYHGTKVPDPVPLARGRHVRRRPPRGSRRRTRSRSRTWRRSPTAQQLHERVKQLNDYPKYSSPSRKGPYYFFSKNDGLQNQSVLYIQKGLDGTPEVLIDPEHVVEDGTDAARRVRAVDRREVRRLRHLEERLRLAAVQGDGAGDEEDAARHARVGQGLGRRVARRRLLLQPLSRAGEGASREGGDQREPPRLLPQGRHAAVAGPPDLPGRRQPAALPHRRHDRGRAVRAADGLGPRQGQGRQRAVRARPVARRSASSTRSSATSATTRYGVVDNVGDKLLVETNQQRAERPRRPRRSARSPRRRTGRRSCRSSPSRCRASARPAASCSRPI